MTMVTKFLNLKSAVSEEIESREEVMAVTDVEMIQEKR